MATIFFNSDNGGISDNGGAGRGHELLGNSLVIVVLLNKLNIQVSHVQWCGNQNFILH